MEPKRALVGTIEGLTLAAFLVSGCTPAIIGAVGIGVNAEGRPVGYIQTCRNSLDRAYVYQ